MPGIARALKLAAASLAALAVGVSTANAAPTVDGEFDIPDGVGSNNEITQGPDGNMWVTRESQNGVARITPEGVVTPFPTTNTAVGITTGPDNNLWVTTALGVAKIDPATGAELNTYDLADNGAGITSGPDNQLWFVAGDKLVSFSPADPEGTDNETTVAGMAGRGMATGSDGLLWIADGSGRVLSATATAAPAVTPFNVDGGPQDVAAGPNAQVAFANPLSSPHEVGLISPGGTPQEIPLETSDPFGVAFGADGAYWIARSSTDDLLRLTPDGQTTTLGGFSISGNVGPRKIAAGPNNTLWVTLDTQEKVARVTGVEPPQPPPGGKPETKLDKAPKKKVKTKKAKAKVKFKFSSPNAGASFECALKKKGKALKFKACSSPKKYKLKPGKYQFQVRAKLGDAVDSSPAKHRFKVVKA